MRDEGWGKSEMSHPKGQKVGYPQVKIGFPLTQDEDGYPPAAWEWLWAVDKGSGTFVLDNTPFFAGGVSYKDIVSAVHEENGLVFRSLVRSSGHSTLRVVVHDAPADMQELRGELERFGCVTELSHIPTLVAVDVPPETPAGPLLQFLDEGEQQGLWEYEESALRHL